MRRKRRKTDITFVDNYFWWLRYWWEGQVAGPHGTAVFHW